MPEEEWILNFWPACSQDCYTKYHTLVQDLLVMMGQKGRDAEAEEQQG